MTLGLDEWLDLVDEAIVRFYEAVASGRVRDDANPAGYPVRIVQNLSFDYLRRSARFGVSSREVQTSAQTDELVASLGAAASAPTLWRGRPAPVTRPSWASCGAWLDLAAERPGVTPSTRAVGERAELSHTAVADVLGRLRREYLPEEGPEP